MALRKFAAAICDVCKHEDPAVWDDDRWIPPRDWIIVRVETADHPIGLKSRETFDTCSIDCARAALVMFSARLPDPHAR